MGLGALQLWGCARPPPLPPGPRRWRRSLRRSRSASAAPRSPTHFHGGLQPPRAPRRLCGQRGVGAAVATFGLLLGPRRSVRGSLFIAAIEREEPALLC